MSRKLFYLTWYSPDNTKWAVLLPGFLDSYEDLKWREFAANLFRMGYNVVIFDPCGLWTEWGEAEDYTVTNYLEDVGTVLGRINKQDLHPDRVLLIGHSLGGFIAFLAAAKYSMVTHVCALCSPPSLAGLASREGWKETGFKTSRRLDPRSNVTRVFKLPYSTAEDMLNHSLKSSQAVSMVQVCSNDTALDPSAPLFLAELMGSEIFVTEGLDHHFGENKDDRTDIRGIRTVWGNMEAFLTQ